MKITVVTTALVVTVTPYTDHYHSYGHHDDGEYYNGHHDDDKHYNSAVTRFGIASVSPYFHYILIYVI